jgi:hypothetical protein
MYRSLFELLALQGYWNAFAGITLPNPASIGLHESLDSQPVGVYRNVGYKLGCWPDVGWWQLLLQNKGDLPEFPTRLPNAAKSSAWNEAIEMGLPMLRL